MFPLRTDTAISRLPFFVYALIITNVSFFVYSFWIQKPEIFISQFGCTPYEITHWKDIVPYIQFPTYFTLMTCMFLHGSWWHLLGNMWFLFVFGKNIEDWLGHSRFILFYLGCGLAASVAQILFSPNSRIPIVGASGAIAGVMGAYLLLFPLSRVLCVVPFFFIIRVIAMPAFLFLGFWFVFQLLLSSGGGGNIAFFAHIGGFIVGFFWVRWLRIHKLYNWR